VDGTYIIVKSSMLKKSYTSVHSTLRQESLNTYDNK